MARPASSLRQVRAAPAVDVRGLAQSAGMSEGGTWRIIRGMGTSELGIAAIVTVTGIVQSIYYVGVPMMLWLIWKKVRHLPG